MDALENNLMKYSFFASFTKIRQQSVQSLTMLNLSGNNISDQGVEYLAHLLQKNKVKSFYKFILN